MRRLGSLAVYVAVAVAAPVAAAPESDGSRIVVVGHGSVKTDPDVVTLSFSIRGEGSTSDQAAADLVRKRGAINDGLAKLLGTALPLRTGELSIKEARDTSCERDDDQPRLSTGACAIRGYVATLDGSVRISPVRDAGTALGLAGRLGASNPQLANFRLLDPADAQRRAEAAAIEDAYRRASGIASASAARLGRLISVVDQEARNSEAMDIVVTGSRPAAVPMMAPAPIAIDLKPEPIDTTATLTVTYAVAP